ncbi:hypothetical protein ABW16_21445 [Mycolicibacter heraklionensis]|uniref:Uncharacterized protein n=2 Tax=Mycolicibacter heraklionensis TaxID=512402 RepID=A0ABR5FA05_9MYCO|nr:hypothetical protein ABW16_21445 [Mycolicibacter heraklionensis]
MREAEEVINRVLARGGENIHSHTEGYLQSARYYLTQQAKPWEAEERAKADAVVEDLARWLSIHIGTWPEDEWNLRAKPNYWHDKARELMEAGWRKGGSDE